jgi:two-component system response regulator AlgR
MPAQDGAGSTAQPLRVLVVDDEPLARRRMAQLLGDCAARMSLEQVGEADSGSRALELAQALAPDAVLTDIAMPGMDGIELARHLQALARPPAVIFVTAFEDHAVRAFELRALDYLLKPVREERLRAALLRVPVPLPQSPQQAPPLAERLAQAAQSLGRARGHLTIVERGRIQLVPVDEVLVLQADQRYVAVRTAQREYLLEESLTALEAEFGGRFLRIHRNALVARAAIASVERSRAGRPGTEGEGAEGAWTMQVRGIAEALPISRRQLPLVREALAAPAPGAG